MGTTLKIFKKSFLINASKFLCGFVIGGVFSFLAQRIGSTSNEETAVENDYPQVYGVDVSFWQGSIQWDQLALPCDDAGFVSGKIPAPRKHRPVQFAFIRVAKGHSIVDSLYQSYYNAAKKQHIPCGAYHFLTDSVSGKMQADVFLSHAQFEPNDLPPVLDVEIDSPTIIEKAKEWLEMVEKECGVKAIIYTNMHMYEKWVKNDPLLNSHDLWLAKPRGEMPDVPNCKFWQFTHDGHVWGIIDNVVDINQFNGTKEELKEYIKTKGIKAK